MKLSIRGKINKLNSAQFLVLGYLAAIVTGGILLALPIAVHGEPLDFISALFTSTSAVCVTGLTVIDIGTKLTTFGQVVVLALVQIGGLGVATMSTLMFLMLGKRVPLRGRLLIARSFNQDSIEGMVRLIKYIAVVTVVTELVGTAILTAHWWQMAGGPRAIWLGLFHAISAFNNAGLDIFGHFQSFTPFVGDIVVNMVIIGLLIVGGLGFIVIAELNSRHEHQLSLHTRMVLFSTGILLAVGFLGFLLLEWSNTGSLGDQPVPVRLLAALFQSVTPRTAGFNTIALGNLQPATLLLTIILMFIGASPGGTGGGVKTTTVTTLIAYIVAIIRGKEEPEFFKRRISLESARKALVVVSLSIICIIGAVLTLTITEGDRFTFIQILFETTSAFGTVGLTLGVTPLLSAAGRLLIAFIMFIGRIGPLTAAIALTPSDPRHPVRYAEEKVIVG